MMRIWVRDDLQFKKRKAAKGSPRKAIDEETKKKAVADLAARRDPPTTWSSATA